jgi:mono/diheme cytochrome c family protein
MKKTIFILLAGMTGVADAQVQGLTPSTGPSQDPAFIDMRHPEAVTGETIFTHICQGCHMPQGQGAQGAGAYPALAHDAKLASSAYPIVMLLNGRGAMPAIGQGLTDDQVAGVVNYIRSHFGNDYHDDVTADQVKAMRPSPKEPSP